jgi:hypothetical protein
MFWRRLRLYLDPFALFKSIAADADALEYNRRHRDVLLAYAKRWAMIALGCAVLLEPLAAAARADPILCVPILGLELGLSTAVCMMLLAIAVYVVLGLED